MNEEPVFSTDNLPSNPDRWTLYRKTALTRMTRIAGPFTVQTREGPLHCDNGFLAMDAHGNFYPIAADEQAAIYREEPMPVGDAS